nr:hypothetical protein [Desulfovibrio sp.]
MAGTAAQTKAASGGTEGAEMAREGVAALARAIMAGRLDEAGRLLDRGADPREALADGTSPLHAAGFQGDAGLARRLLACGADPASRDGEGAT